MVDSPDDLAVAHLDVFLSAIRAKNNETNVATASVNVPTAVQSHVPLKVASIQPAQSPAQSTFRALSLLVRKVL